MSCLDVMYHQSYGAHYLSASPAAAAVAYKAAYYHHHHQQQQQKKLSVHSKMQEYADTHLQQQGPGARHPQHHRQAGGGRDRIAGDQGLRRGPEGPGSGGLASSSGSASGSALKDGSQPAEAEYLNSRCVLFTYFHGDIGDVVDEHFSRALSQPSAFTIETKAPRISPSAGTSSTGLWPDTMSLSENQSGPVPSPPWSTAYPSQANPCLSSVSVHPDFSPSPISFHPTDGALWVGHPLSQPSLPPPGAIPDPWAYSLSPQAGANYPHVHDVYPHRHTHSHVHHRHPVLHSHPARGPALDPRFSPLLLRTHPVHSPGTHGSPHGEMLKTEMDPSSPNLSPASTATSASWPLHGAHLEAYDSALDQDKLKTSVWF